MERKEIARNARIAIVNRGEAAVRFIRAVKEFNTLHGTLFESVALYIDVESDGLFVKEADHAYNLSKFRHFEKLSGSPYLNAEFMLDVIKTCSCESVWVGWGFLAEDPAFAALLQGNQIELIGPSSHAMEVLGDKIRAKELADETKVPTTPWSGRPLKDLQDAQEQAEKIGYPVILKSANGGGGRGIRKVFKPEQLEQAFKSVSEEIFRFFGNKIIFMEALVARGRHLEVQCVADYHGNVKTFGVRDCSVQRNNQKIIEETPPCGMAQSVFDELESCSARLLQAANYHGAGTVEYLYDIDRQQPFFMEVNTRLQVEHPITEELYHTDLVHLQIQVALGENLKELPTKSPNGHVIEVRLNAEDPENNFAPTPGKIKRYLPPQLPGIRLDAGIEWGSTIPREFDSMIAKIIARAPDRKSAIAKLTRALRELQIEIDNGTTNQGFLLELLASEEVKKGGVQTNFVEQYLNQTSFTLKSDWDIAVIAGAIYLYEQKFANDFENFAEKIRRFSLPRNIPNLGSEFPIQHHGQKYGFYIRSMGNNVFHIEADGKQLVAEYVNWGHEIILKTNRKKYKLQIVPRSHSLQCEIDGIPYVIPLDAGGSISAPSPSVVLSVIAQPGQEVKQGDLLLTLEAMKMEMTVTAPDDGIVSQIFVRAGEQVAAGQKLVEMETKKDESSEKKEEESSRLGFEDLEVGQGREVLSSLDDQWQYLSREYFAVFIGYDYTKPVGSILIKLEDFVEKHPDFKARLGTLILDSCRAFITIQKLFKSDIQGQNSSRESEFDECLMHYFLRREDREKGLPERFLSRLGQAIALYPWAEQDDYNDTTLALFHIYKSFTNHQDQVELARLGLFTLQKIYGDVPHICSKEELTELLNGMIDVGTGKWVLVDAATHTRYELVDRLLQEETQEQRTEMIAQLLNSVLLEPEEAKTSEKEIIESGHQILSHLVSLSPENSTKEEKILQLIAKRFTRDRTYLEGEYLVKGEKSVFMAKTTKYNEVYSTVVKILDEAEFFSSLKWLNVFLEDLERKNLEVILLVRRDANSSELKFTNHLEQNELLCDVCWMGLYTEDRYIYRSFIYKDDQWQESKRRRYFSPLRYRELHLDRLIHFEVDLVYHSRYVHVLKLEAKDNPKDQRIFAFVEIPETTIELNKAKSIQRIGNFEYGILEAIQAIREQQARQKRQYFWNRIIVHIGQTHPLRLEQIGEYPKTIANMLRGLGLEKITIYSKIAGRQREAIDAEVLVENFSTKYSIRGRIPSREPLQSLDPYTSKVVRSLRRNSAYPYEIINMLTDASSEDFPSGRFEEFDIQFDSTGNQQTISVEGRPYGNNISNVVFGKIFNLSDGVNYERVILLGDPSRDLGSLAEGECRRVIAAIDLAERDGIPVEWIPVSSGAAIDMETGTENLDWTARVLRRIIEFTQKGGEINIIVSGINVGAQSYWNAEATMLQHTNGLLIMTDQGTMVLTGKKALDFSGSVSAEDNVGIGGVEKIMGPNGQSQYRTADLAGAYHLLFRHYRLAYRKASHPYGQRKHTMDASERDVCQFPYSDPLNQGFEKIGDILGKANAERKKPFDMRQIMQATRDQDADYLERWHHMRDAETAIVWETQIGGFPVGLIGIESRPLKRYGDIPNDGPDSWTGGTLYPLSSKKVSRAINAYSNKLPLVILANLSGFDGSPESLRKLQLEYGAEIGRAVVNFKGSIIFVVISRYHGGAYVVFSKTLNPNMKVVALENTFASVIGGAPAAAVVFPREVLKNTFSDPQVVKAQEKLRAGTIEKTDYDELFQKIHLEHQAKLAQQFERIHSVERALKVGSIDDIVKASHLRSYLVRTLEVEIAKSAKQGV